jgi:peroxiredoxin Q/BCP
MGKETAMAIDTGDPLPAFDLPTDGGGRLRTEDLKGKITVLYFYPKDDTPQCTKQAEAFRDAAAAYAEAGVTVVGVSTDGVTSHDKFKAKRSLPFALVSDAGAGLAQDLGIWVEKSMYGKKYMGVERSTFLVDGNGIVRRVWRKVKVPGHAAEVLAAAKTL